MSKSDAWENSVLALATGQSPAITIPVTPYIGLFTGALSGDTPGTEVTGGGYARVSGAGKFAAPVGGSCANNATIAFAQATGAWSAGAPLTHFGLFNAASGGAALYYGALTDITKVVGNGDTVSFIAGSLTITED